MKQPITLSHELEHFFGEKPFEDASRLVNGEFDGPQLCAMRVRAPFSGLDRIADVLDILASHIRANHPPIRIVTTPLGADVEPSAEFYRGVEDGMKSSRVCGVMAGLVGFECGAFLAVLLLTIGGVA